MSSLFSLLRNRLVSIPNIVVIFGNIKQCMFLWEKANTPIKTVIILDCEVEILSFLSLDNFTGETSERCPDKDESK